MYFFINAGVLSRKGTFKVKTEHNKIKLSIPNWIENQNKHEDIHFIFSDTHKNGTLLTFRTGVSLKHSSNNTYQITVSQNSNKKNNVMYALLRSVAVVPDDVFIPANMKKKVQVIRKIRYVDSEVDYGNFLSNVYLVKVILDMHESLPVYYSCTNPSILEHHDVIYRSKWEDAYRVRVCSNLKTFIFLNDKNKDKYISLSALCEN